MERKLYLELCQRQATKGGVLVEYCGIAYQPYAYELKFQPDGKIKHTAILKEPKANCLVYCRLEDVKKNEMEAKEDERFSRYSKNRYDRGCVVYNTNNYTYGIVLNGKFGEDKDPCSQVLELTGRDVVMVHTPPNRALIPTGRFVDVAKMIKHAIGEEA